MIHNSFPKFILFFSILITISNIGAQISYSDPSGNLKEFNSLEEALKNPESVIRLNLSNQTIKFPPDSVWAKFSNLEYLSLKNDHLKAIPSGISNLRKLRTLDLGGNDFKFLPPSFSKLQNLHEIYLNDDKFMDIPQIFSVLKDLKQLRILHLENDRLKEFPSSILLLDKIERLYLNNNELREFPKEVYRMKSLKYLDLHDNKYHLRHPDNQGQNYGFKIVF